MKLKIKNKEKLIILFSVYFLQQVFTFTLPINSFAQFLPGSSEQNEVKIRSKKFKINGISLGSSERDIIRVFGKPLTLKRSVNTTGDCGKRGTSYTSIFYKGTKFVLSNGYLSAMSTTNPQYKTESGIKVGDRTEAAKLKYSNYGKIEKHYEAWENGFNISPFAFFSRNGKIKKIDLGDNSC